MIDHIEKLLSLREIDAIWHEHCKQMAGYGFDRLLYAFTRFHKLHAFGNLDDMLILSNHDPDYLKVYIGERLFESAPMVKHAATHEGAFSWSLVGEMKRAGQLSPAELAATEFNRQHGVQAGYSISFPDTTAHKGGIGLCARAGLTQVDVEAIWARHRRDITVLNTIFHLQVSSLPFARNLLSNRQREALEGVANGKTTADIAEAMGVSIPTVEKHLRRAREALAAETTAQAVLKATMQQQLFQTAAGLRAAS